MAEALLIAAVTSIVLFVLAFSVGACRERSELKTEESEATRGYFCAENEYNDMATLAFNPQEIAIKVGAHSLKCLVCSIKTRNPAPIDFTLV